MAGPPSRRSRWLLAGIVVAFLAARLPFVLLQPGAQDEQWFAAPGYTVATEGIPRLPFVPNRNPEGVFYKADVALFTLPPAFFYLQAPFFLVLPPGYPTGRMPSVLAGAAAICLTYVLGRRWLNESAALWGAGLYSLSRVFFFPATFARPDMLCGAVGLAVLWVLDSWHTARSWWKLVVAGGLLGIGLLSHPFASVYCVLAGMWVLLAGRGLKERFGGSAVLVACSAGVAAAWLPLILAHEELFWAQFGNNVLKPQGPGLLSRLLAPWPYFAHQFRLLRDQAAVWQTCLMLAGLVAATLWSRRLFSHSRRLVWITWGLVYLLAASQGGHPTKGYLCLPGALMFLCVGQVLTALVRRLTAAGPVGRAAALACAATVVLLMAPGAGSRAWWVQVRHWSNPNYNGPRFAQQLLAELPREGQFVVDTQYVFDVWLSGRKTVLDADALNYYLVEDYPYDFLVAGREGLDKRSPERYRGVFVRSFGARDDPFGCYAEVYRAP